jgi:hypothetical protein
MARIFDIAGTRIEINTAIIVIVTRSSTIVNARRMAELREKSSLSFRWIIQGMPGLRLRFLRKRRFHDVAMLLLIIRHFFGSRR